MHDRVILNALLAPISFEELCKDAMSIVMGRVNRVLPGKVDKDKLTGRPLVYTDIEINVKEWLKNRQSFDKIIVRSLGGETPELSMDAPGAARFAPRENVVVFLSKQAGSHFELPENGFVVEGWAAGKYSVQQDFAYSPLQPKPLPIKEFRGMINKCIRQAWGTVGT